MKDDGMHVSGGDLVELGRHVTDCSKHEGLWCSCKVRQYLDLLSEVGALRQPDVRPISGDQRERIARIVYAFGYANGAFMHPWESASRAAQQDALSHADAILRQLDVSADQPIPVPDGELNGQPRYPTADQPNTGWRGERNIFGQPIITSRSQLDVSAVPGDEDGA